MLIHTSTREALPISHVFEQFPHKMTSWIEILEMQMFNQEIGTEDTVQGPELFPHIPPGRS